MATKRTVTAKCPKSNKSATINFNAPDTVAEAVKLWGEDVVLSNLLGSVVISIQGGIRRMLEAKTPATQEQISQHFAAYIPKKAAERMDPVERMAAKIKEMSPEKRAAILAMLKEKAAAPGQK